MNPSSATNGPERAESLSVEVVLCTYNGSRFVEEQLRSILRQSHPVSRVTVRDDASVDDTLSRVERCVRAAGDHAPPVVVLRNERNLGYAANFAAGIASAVCDVIVLSDQDDLWEPDKVATLHDALVDAGADLAFSDGVPIDENGEPIGGPTVLQALGVDIDRLDDFPRRAWCELLRRNVVNGAALAVKRAAAQAALPLPPGVPHDQWLALWSASHGGVIAIRRPLYRYRQHGGNVIGMGSQRLLYQWLGVWRQPRRPRRRELAIWRDVVDRLLPEVPATQAGPLRAKLEFLEAVVGTEAEAGRLAAIVMHWCRGSYRRYAAEWGLARDLVGVLRDPDRGRVSR